MWPSGASCGGAGGGARLCRDVGAELSLARLIAGMAGCALLRVSLHGWSAAVLPHGSAGVLASRGARYGGCYCMVGVLPCCRTEQRECVSIDGTHFSFGAWERQAIPQSAFGRQLPLHKGAKKFGIRNAECGIENVAQAAMPVRIPEKPLALRRGASPDAT